MRERERVERERQKGRRGRSRAISPKRKPHGYTHTVDQASISFFVTNFPEYCSSEELWERFARFRRVGDVFIPKKVDKWGMRFAFVKFMEEKEAEELNQRLQDGRSFKSALVKSYGEQQGREVAVVDCEEVLEVEVDEMVLKDLERRCPGG
ncbi:RNA recognition motif [Trifolium medium]|uniref:RNA recognition motif n=1 Tax=Trifolium medium TaxID=97028 RepID=A0A392NSS9_9FABA|nr:RNA recognition motif [Trifolium medium]